MSNSNWNNRIVKYGNEDPGQLLANEWNWRIHPQEQQDALEDSLDIIGWVQDVIINLRTSDEWGDSQGVETILDGHARVKLALRHNQDSVPVKYVDLSPIEERQILASLDPIGAMAARDDKMLAEIVNSVLGEGGIIPGLDDKEIDRLLGVLAGDAQQEDNPPSLDKAEELNKKWQVELGDIWQAGEHFIICGDCREPDTWKRLLDAAGIDNVNGVFTSPPYAEQRKEQYGGVPTTEYVDWWEAVQANVRSNLADDGSFFVNIKEHCEDGQRVLYCKDLLIAMVRQWGWRWVDELCWRRASLPGSFNNRFKNYFEPVYHFCVLDRIKFNPENVKTDRVYSNPRKNRKNKSGTGSGLTYNPGGFITDDALPSNVIDVWNGDGNGAHSAAFPIALPEFFVKAYSDNSDVWCDPFLGSGTTIVAAHKNGRVGIGIEKLEKYVAVCLERLSNLGLVVSKISSLP